MTQQNLYVPVSRATDEFVIVTDDREALAAQIERESGQKETALEGDHFRNPFPNRNPKDISENHFGIGNAFPKDISESETTISTPTPMPWETPIDVRVPDILVVEAPTPQVPEFDFDR
ncbi:MAG: hypothetical protein ACYC0P_03055 [Thiobacillus sp.]